MTDRPARAGMTPKTMTVLERRWLGPEMARIVCGGPDIEGLELPFADQYVKLLFPGPRSPFGLPVPNDLEGLERHEGPVTRTYTIRPGDQPGQVWLDMFVHDGGLASRWAAEAEPGDQITFRGPGGAWEPAASGRMLMVGDEAAWPALAEGLRRRKPGVTADIRIEVSSPEGELPLDLVDGDNVVWLHRGERPRGEMIAELAADLTVPEGGYSAVFVHGNAELVRPWRRRLMGDLGMPNEILSVSGYWRTGHNEDKWQATKRDFVAEMDADLKR